jgi:hypothetical protein
MKSYDHYSAGQNYTDVTLNVYKSNNEKCILSSFENYNVGLQSYQQLPWIANFDGVGIWIQSRTTNTILQDIGINSTNPAISQSGCVLVAVYRYLYICICEINCCMIEIDFIYLLC